MGAETHYLNAMEALDEGDRERAKAEAKKATSIDAEHYEAWSIYIEACLPPAGVQPTMAEAAQALSAVKRVVAGDPSRMDMWMRGGDLCNGFYNQHLRFCGAKPPDNEKGCIFGEGRITYCELIQI